MHYTLSDLTTRILKLCDKEKQKFDDAFSGVEMLLKALMGAVAVETHSFLGAVKKHVPIDTYYGVMAELKVNIEKEVAIIFSEDMFSKIEKISETINKKGLQ